MVLLLAGLPYAQDSQFPFDANGNLLVQSTASSAPPQIIGQPQNRVVVPGEATSFFVVAADTRPPGSTMAIDFPNGVRLYLP